MNNKQKGQYGYLKAYRKGKITGVLIFSAMILFIVITLLIQFKSTKHVMVVFAILLALPLAKFLIAYILCARLKPLCQNDYDKIINSVDTDKCELIFDVGITRYEGLRFYQSICVKNNQIYALCIDKNFDNNRKDYILWLEDSLTTSKNIPVIKLFSDADKYVSKINSCGIPSDSTKKTDNYIKEQLLSCSI